MKMNYTNSVLTVIAFALCVLVAKDLVLPAEAARRECGSVSNPCYVKVSGGSLSVHGGWITVDRF